MDTAQREWASSSGLLVAVSELQSLAQTDSEMTPQEYKAIREKLALTQGGLAASLGVTRKTINARETGATRITEEAALAIRALKRR